MLPKNHDIGNTRFAARTALMGKRRRRLARASEPSWRDKKDSSVRNMKGGGDIFQVTIGASVEAGAKRVARSELSP
jgi:hypothetical protein